LTTIDKLSVLGKYNKETKTSVFLTCVWPGDPYAGLAKCATPESMSSFEGCCCYESSSLV